MVKLDTHEARSERRTRALSEVLREHTSYKDALTSDPDIVAKYPRAVIDYYSFTQVPDTRDNVQVLWFYGATGSGKTFYARRILEQLAEQLDPDFNTYNQKVYTTSSNLKWWFGYEGQRAVLIDELRWQCLGDLGFPYLLRLLDKGSVNVEFKNGSVNFRGRWIIITAQDDPDTTFQHQADLQGNKRSHENIGQLIRRLQRIIEFSGYFDPETNQYTTIRTDVTEQYRARFNVLHQNATRDAINTTELINEYFTTQ